MTSQTASNNLGLHGRMSELHSVLHNALFLTHVLIFASPIYLSTMSLLLFSDKV